MILQSVSTNLLSFQELLPTEKSAPSNRLLVALYNIWGTSKSVCDRKVGCLEGSG